MKKISLAILSVSLFAATSFADSSSLGMRKGSYGQAGCGLGSMVFEENGTFQQVLAATTNGTFGSQTFGISSGTSNCTSGGVAMLGKEQEMFAEANFETLSEEMAQGQGETLSAFANLLGCEDSATATFGQVCKNAYAGQLAKAETPNQLLEMVKAEVKSNPSLVASCKL